MVVSDEIINCQKCSSGFMGMKVTEMSLLLWKLVDRSAYLKRISFTVGYWDARSIHSYVYVWHYIVISIYYHYTFH